MTKGNEESNQRGLGAMVQLKEEAVEVVTTTWRGLRLSLLKIVGVPFHDGGDCIDPLAVFPFFQKVRVRNVGAGSRMYGL